jgi:hypothetical protein
MTNYDELKAAQDFFEKHGHADCDENNMMDLPDNGLRAGEWDILVDKIISDGSQVHGEKNQVIRIILNRETTWNDLLKLLPQGSMIRSWRRMR